MYEIFVTMYENHDDTAAFAAFASMCENYTALHEKFNDIDAFDWIWDHFSQKYKDSTIDHSGNANHKARLQDNTACTKTDPSELSEYGLVW